MVEYQREYQRCNNRFHLFVCTCAKPKSYTLDMCHVLTQYGIHSWVGLLKDDQDPV